MLLHALPCHIRGGAGAEAHLRREHSSAFSSPVSPRHHAPPAAAHGLLFLGNHLGRSWLRVEACAVAMPPARPAVSTSSLVVPPSVPPESTTGNLHGAAAGRSRGAAVGASDLGYPTDLSKHYQLVEMIGEGMYGTVWLALPSGGGGPAGEASDDDTPVVSSGAQVAVKVLLKDRAGKTREENLEAIRNEIDVWRQCHSSSFVARLFSVYEDASSVFLVQELCRGGDLKTLLDSSGPMTERAVARVMHAVLDVILECHTHQLVFNDIKPANFMLRVPCPVACMGQQAQDRMKEAAAAAAAAAKQARSPLRDCHSRLDGDEMCHSLDAEDGGGALHGGQPQQAGSGNGVVVPGARKAAAAPSQQPLVCNLDDVQVTAIDFGCCQTFRDCRATGRRLGTPVYMAPEVWCHTCFSGAPGVSDVWAAGVMMYQLLCSRYPFWDVDRDQVDKNMPLYQVMLAACSSPICFSGPLWRGVSREARELLTMMLDRNSATRITAEAALQHPWFQRMLPVAEVAALRKRVALAASGQQDAPAQRLEQQQQWAASDGSSADSEWRADSSGSSSGGEGSVQQRQAAAAGSSQALHQQDHPPQSFLSSASGGSQSHTDDECPIPGRVLSIQPDGPMFVPL